MSSVTITKPAPGIGPAAARPPQVVSTDPAQRRAQLESRWRIRLERVTGLSLAYCDAAQLARCGQCREPISAPLLARQPHARYCPACACLALQGRPAGLQPVK